MPLLNFFPVSFNHTVMAQTFPWEMLACHKALHRKDEPTITKASFTTSIRQETSAAARKLQPTCSPPPTRCRLVTGAMSPAESRKGGWRAGQNMGRMKQSWWPPHPRHLSGQPAQSSPAQPSPAVPQPLH